MTMLQNWGYHLHILSVEVNGPSDVAITGVDTCRPRQEIVKKLEHYQWEHCQLIIIGYYEVIALKNEMQAYL